MRLSLILLASASLPAAVSATTYHVPSQYATINQGLDAAAAGDTVLVAPGTYTNYETRLIDPGNGFLVWVTSCAFMKDDVTLRSEGGSALTAIDLMEQGTAPRSPVMCALLYSGNVTIEGFRIQGSGVGEQGEVFIQECNRITVRDCQFEGADSGTHFGGAIYALYGELYVENCSFLNCAAAQGSAIWLGEYELTILDSVFENCTNGAVVTFGTHGVRRRFVLKNSRFVGNERGLVAAGQDAITIEDCWFEDNVVLGGDGGAAVWIGDPSPVGIAALRRNVFWKNHCVDLTSGALYWRGYRGTLRRNIFYGNTLDAATDGGSAMVLRPDDGQVIEVSNNIVAANLGGEAIRVISNTDPESSCNVFWDNPDGDFLYYPVDPTDLFVDPRLCSPEIGDFTVAADSPCLPENNDGCGTIGPFGEGCGSVSIDPMSWAQLKGLYRLEGGP